MGKKGGGGTQTVVEKNDPPAIVQPHLAQLYGAAGDWFGGGQGRDVWGGMVAPPRPWRLSQSLDRLADVSARGLGSQGLDQAQWNAANTIEGGYLRNNPVANGSMLWDNNWTFGAGIRDNPTARGDYLNGNPYLDKMVEAATRDVRDDFMESIAPSLASQFSAAGRTGSGAHVGAFTGAASKLAGRLGDLSGNLRGQAYQFERGLQDRAYESERQRQFGAYEAERGARRQALLQDPQTRLQASALLPALGQARYLDIDKLAQGGLLEMDIEQNRIDREMERFNQGRDLPLNRLMAYSSILQGATPYMSSNQTTSSAAKYNRLSGAIGGGLGGYALGSMLPVVGGPMGAMLGALGGLFG